MAGSDDKTGAAPSGGEKPWDAALGAVSKQLDEATKGVRDARNEARGVLRDNVTQAKELSSSARIAIANVARRGWEVVQRAISPAVQVFDQANSNEGTPLRKHFAAAREGVNRQLYDAQVWRSPRFCSHCISISGCSSMRGCFQVKYEDTKKSADVQLAPIKSGLALAQIRKLDGAAILEVRVFADTLYYAELLKANEFRREHPEAAAAGVVVAVAIPSLLLSTCGELTEQWSSSLLTLTCRRQVGGSAELAGGSWRRRRRGLRLRQARGAEAQVSPSTWRSQSELHEVIAAIRQPRATIIRA